MANYFCLVFFCFLLLFFFFLFNLFAFSSVVNMGSYGYEIFFFSVFYFVGHSDYTITKRQNQKLAKKSVIVDVPL